MALLDVDSVVNSVCALHDDPGSTDMDIDYVLPFLNLRWSNLVVNLVMLGLQYSEETTVIPALPPNTLSLRIYMLPGQPLASLMQVKAIDWKLVGEPDTSYDPADPVNELDDVDSSSQGVGQWSWQGGNCFLPPSSVPVTLRVRYQCMSTTLVDPDDTMIRGVGDIIAYRTAELIAKVRGNDALALACKEFGDTALDDFIAMSVMRQQGQFLQMAPTHRRGALWGRNFTYPTAR